jgi:hypothetical protein
MPQCDYKYLFFILWQTCLVLKVRRRERDLNPRDLHRSQANKVQFPGLRPPRLGDPGIRIFRNKFYILTIKQFYNCRLLIIQHLI